MRSYFITFVSLAAVAALYGCTQDSNARQDEQAALAAQIRDPLQTVVRLSGPMPTGVAVSSRGRVFVNFPRWGDQVDFTVAEVVDGKPIAYPNAEMNKLETQPDAQSLMSVQNVVIDEKDRLWILDTGSIKMEPVTPGGPKLLCVDLQLNRVIKRFMFPDNVALPTTYLNDVRFDFNRGAEGMAYITDSSDKGPNGIIVLDIASGKSWRKLNDHPSTKADPGFAPIVEGSPLMVREPGKPEEAIKIGSDGIELDARKGVLYYCPLGSRRLHRIKLDLLTETTKDEETAAGVENLPERDFASDGLLLDTAGTLYLTNYEHNSIRRYDEGQKTYSTVVTDPRMIWPDTMALGPEGWIYFTANQLNRQPKFNNGKDLRQKPYLILRTRLAAQPVAAR